MALASKGYAMSFWSNFKSLFRGKSIDPDMTEEDLSEIPLDDGYPPVMLVGAPGAGSLSFNLIVGFDVDTMATDGRPNQINIFVNKLIFTSSNIPAKAFVEGAPESILKTTISTLCLAAGKHILAPVEGVSFVKTTVSDDDLPELDMDPIDKKTLLN